MYEARLNGTFVTEILNRVKSEFDNFDDRRKLVKDVAHDMDGLHWLFEKPDGSETGLFVHLPSMGDYEAMDYGQMTDAITGFHNLVTDYPQAELHCDIFDDYQYGVAYLARVNLSWDSGEDALH